MRCITLLMSLARLKVFDLWSGCFAASVRRVQDVRLSPCWVTNVLSCSAVGSLAKPAATRVTSATSTFASVSLDLAVPTTFHLCKICVLT